MTRPEPARRGAPETARPRSRAESRARPLWAAPSHALPPKTLRS